MSEVKLLSFEQTDFKFSAAYDAYSHAFKKSDNPEEKARLNTLITDLNDGRMSYPDFYDAIKSDGVDERHRFHRTRISTQRKYEYRKEEQKSQRSKRYR